MCGHGMSHYAMPGFWGLKTTRSLQKGGTPQSVGLRRRPKLPQPSLAAGSIDPIGDMKLRRKGKKHHQVNTQDLPPDSPHQPKEPACPHLLRPAEPLRSPPDLTLPLSSLLRFNSSHGRIRGLQSPFQSSKMTYLIYGKRRVLCYILGEEKDEKKGAASGGQDR